MKLGVRSLEGIETARRAITRSSRDPLGKRSARAIDRSLQIERTDYRPTESEP